MLTTRATLSIEILKFKICFVLLSELVYNKKCHDLILVFYLYLKLFSYISSIKLFLVYAYILKNFSLFMLIIKKVKFLPGLWVSSKETLWMKPYAAKSEVLKCTPNSLFSGYFKSFGTKSKRLLHENYVLPYHTTDTGLAEIF